jgi:hypothetical protein
VVLVVSATRLGIWFVVLVGLLQVAEFIEDSIPIR